MACLTIHTFPDPILKKVCAPVKEVDEEVRRLIDEMAETMYAAPGSGLAAPQVGVDKRVIVYDTSPKSEPRELVVLVNPEIVASGGDEIFMEEGCLSCPDLIMEIPRAEWIKVQGLDREGRPVTFETEDFPAIVIQHEIDHLNGQTLVDHLSSLKRSSYRRKQQRAKERDAAA
ncbi:MAG: peptide deformylase [Deltaproteobacteria bacterium]|nr:peptide deformylase [Deltaproteobacteria bacterium]